MSKQSSASPRRVDMLGGSLVRNILLFAFPLALSSIMQHLFNVADVAVLGHYASPQAMAAAGSNSPVINLIINLFVGLSVGANVLIANCIGQRSDEGVRRAVATAAAVALGSGLVLMVLGQVLARPILELISTPPDVIDMAVVYLRIYFGGIPFVMAFNFGSAILRSVGDTARPLRCLLVGGVVNVLLNLLLVAVFRLGVVGVGVATMVAHAVSAVLVVRLLLREEGPVRLVVKDIRVHRPSLRKMVAIGLPAGVQGMVFSISNVAVLSAINSFGSSAVAGSTIGLYYEQFCYYVMAAFCGAATTFVGQNYGAGNYARCRLIFRRCMAMALAVCGFLNVFIWLTDSFFISIFSTDSAVAPYAHTRMTVALALQFIACGYEIGGSVLRGMGLSFLPALMTIFGTCLLRLVWVFWVFPLHSSFAFLMAVYPVSWAVTSALVLTAYFVVAGKKLSPNT